MKIIKRILLVLLLFVLVSGTGLYLWLVDPFVHVPSIAENLPSNVELARRTFKDRVSDSYPIGSPEAELIEELQKQKFKLNIIDKTKDSINSAMYSYASIEWITDKESNLVEIHGDRRLHCL